MLSKTFLFFAFFLPACNGPEKGPSQSIKIPKNASEKQKTVVNISRS